MSLCLYSGDGRVSFPNDLRLLLLRRKGSRKLTGFCASLSMAIDYFWHDCGTKCSYLWSSALPQYSLYVLSGGPWIRAWVQTHLVCGAPSDFKSTCSSTIGVYELVKIKCAFSWLILMVTTGKCKAACLNHLSLKGSSLQIHSTWLSGKLSSLMGSEEL